MLNKLIYSFLISITLSLSLLADDTIPHKIQSPTVCYIVDKKLGEGVFGCVYEVHDSNGNKFAIKSYKNHDEDGINGLLFADVFREFNIGQTLNHPNIVKTYDLFQIENSYYMVMELVKGASLHQTPKHLISHKNAMTASKKLMDVIKYAYSMELLYIDLHGGNVVLNENDLKFVDVASFFTFPEIFGYFINGLASEKSSKNRVLEEKLGNVKLSRAQIAKLDAYFKNNPEKSELLKSLTLAIGEHALEKNTQEKEEELRALYKIWYLNFYIDNITKILEEIHTKSDCNKEDRINYKVKINKVVWEYQDDISEGHYFPFDYLLEKLTRSLK